ncbi:hypothetical protein [Brenneria tiliae]|uniref:Uncharacterized protein n=1 Tax=Brenneria tiliae TaxID=2914984 RepID=A0ABT0MSE1_9GAMM|nr:hypothetical protein [Brenneria tiliae]MCL2892114.1 hypothetical protein [Brenneria tiliae]
MAEAPVNRFRAFPYPANAGRVGRKRSQGAAIHDMSGISFMPFLDGEKG